jgi:hypothetical protein
MAAKRPSVNDSAFYHPCRECLQLFRGPREWAVWCCETKEPPAAFIGLAAARRSCAVQKGNVLAINEGARTVAHRDESTPPIGKELPVELTATMTAIMAIISFGFVAAVILGMI